jgi:hypothetical protein
MRDQVLRIFFADKLTKNRISLILHAQEIKDLKSSQFLMRLNT